MDLIQRLRPKWKHPDPEVRAEAARELGAEHQDRLESLARTDPDPHVRRIAIKKLADAGLLDALAATTATRRCASLRPSARVSAPSALACSDAPLAECEAALAALQDERSLSPVAVGGGARGRPPGGAGARVRRSRAARRRAAARPIRRSGAPRWSASPTPACSAHRRRRRAARARARGGRAYRRRRGRCARSPTTARAPKAVRAARAGAARRPTRSRRRSRFKEATRAAARAVHDRRGAHGQEPDVVRAAIAGARGAARVAGARAPRRAARRTWRASRRRATPSSSVAGSLARRQAEADTPRAPSQEGLAARRALCERVEGARGRRARGALADGARRVDGARRRCRRRCGCPRAALRAGRRGVRWRATSGGSRGTSRQAAARGARRRGRGAGGRDAGAAGARRGARSSGGGPRCRGAAATTTRWPRSASASRTPDGGSRTPAAKSSAARRSCGSRT